MIFHVNNRRWV